MDDIEAIKQLKARYFRLMDTKQWSAFADLFTPDAEVQATPDPAVRFVGRDDIVEKVSRALADAVTVHHGHMPEIELTAPDRATGIWAMWDFVDLPTIVLRGYGHYHDVYAKQEGRWRIREIRLTRLRVDLEPRARDGGGHDRPGAGR